MATDWLSSASNATKASRNSSAVSGSTALRASAKRSIETTVIGPSFSTATLGMSASLQHAKRRVDQHDLALLVLDGVGGAHQRARGVLGSRLDLAHLDFDMNRVADIGRALDVEAHRQEGQTRPLQGGRDHQPLGHGIDQGARHRMAAAHGGMALDVFLVGEQLLGKAAKSYEIEEVGLEERAAVGDEAVADLEFAPVPALAELFHGCCLSEHARR